MKEGQLHMNVGGWTLTCQLRSESLMVRRVARPLKWVVVELMMRSTIRCAVEPPYDETQ